MAGALAGPDSLWECLNLFDRSHYCTWVNWTYQKVYVHRGLWWPCVKRGKRGTASQPSPSAGYGFRRCRGCPTLDETRFGRVLRVFEARSCLAPKRRLEATYQVPLIEGLAQKADRACIEHTPSELFLREGSYEYDRRVDTLRNQQALQIGPAQARHLHVRDHARSVVEAIGFEKFLSRCKGMGVQSERLDEPPRRVAHGNVIVNNRNHGDLRHAGFLEGSSHEERYRGEN